MTEYRARFRGTPSSVREARQAVVDYARLCGFQAQATFDIALGVGEALANAVEHGNRDLGFITVTARFVDGTLEIESPTPASASTSTASRRSAAIRARCGDSAFRSCAP